MNMEITKYKSNFSADALNNRLMRLEKMLQIVLELSGNTPKNQNNSLINGSVQGGNGNIHSKLLAELASISIANTQTSNINQPSFTISPQVRQQANTAKSGVNNLLLSQSQIIAQIAAAIAIAGQRNS